MEKAGRELYSPSGRATQSATKMGTLAVNFRSTVLVARGDEAFLSSIETSGANNETGLVDSIGLKVIGS